MNHGYYGTCIFRFRQWRALCSEAETWGDKLSGGGNVLVVRMELLISQNILEISHVFSASYSFLVFASFTVKLNVDWLSISMTDCSQSLTLWELRRRGSLRSTAGQISLLRLPESKVGYHTLYQTKKHFVTALFQKISSEERPENPRT